MATKPNIGDFVTIDIINDAELLKLFKELQTAVQNKIVVDGLRDSANIIKEEVKKSFQSIKKNKSKTNYKYIKRSFQIAKLKKGIGLKVGVKNIDYEVDGKKTASGYKLRWLQWGVDQRSYKRGVSRKKWDKEKDKSGGHKTGSLDKTNFFWKAVEKATPAAQSKVSEEIIKSLEATVRKYNK